MSEERKHELRQAAVWASRAKSHAEALAGAIGQVFEGADAEEDEEEILYLLDQAQSAIGKARAFVQKHYAGGGP